MPKPTPAYHNPSLSVEERVTDLLGRMTLEEKVGQLMMLEARSEELSFINTYQPGSILHILGEKVDRAMDLAAQNRLGIPLLVGEDAIHGHSFWKGATIFPTQLAMSASWNPALLEQVGRVTAEEVVPTGIHWTFSPVLCLARDLRWGRIGETFGEDPFLIGELGAALIRGYQGRGLDDPAGILATAKHYAGYSETQGGRDASEADISHRKLRSYFLPPFERAVRAGAMAFMTGYQSIEGVPSTANRWLLAEILKDEWGYQGVIVTDWDNVGRLVKEQKICANYVEAAIVAVRAGNDIMMTTPEFYEAAIEAVRTGRLAESEIEAPCARFLALKFRLGLFEDPRRPDLQKADFEINRPEHRAVNLEAARQSLVLLQNIGLLPLKPEELKSIAVVGPNADDDLQQLGDWSLGSFQHPPSAGKHPREKTTTILDGLRALAPAGLSVRYERGCSIVEADLSGIPAAVAAAQAADVVVAVVGDHLKYIGETLSTATLELQGGQVALLDALAQTGKPMIVVLVNSKPLVLPDSAKRAAAIVELFNPGMQGGRALAEALFGLLNPSGKLAISIPVHVGQQPVFYSQVRGQHGDRYADLTQEPLFPFGHGLSYTRYAYSNLRLDTPMSHGQSSQVSVDVENIGQRAGVEIVQVYVSDVVTSATWVNKALKGFARVELAPGEKKTVQVELPWQSFQIVNAHGVSVVEPGEFEILVGPSSRDQDLLAAELMIG